MIVAKCSGCGRDIDELELDEDAADFSDGFFSGPAGTCSKCGTIITYWDFNLSRDDLQEREREKGERSMAGPPDPQVGQKQDYGEEEAKRDEG